MALNIVGKFMRKLLDSEQLTQVQLAEIMGCSPQTVSNRLSGTQFRHEELLRISEYFDMSVDEILNGGSFRSTELFKYVQQDITEMDPHDAPIQPDSTGKTLLDYVIELDDFEKFNYIYSNDFELGPLHLNSKFTAFLIRHKRLDMFVNGVESKIKSSNSYGVSFMKYSGEVYFPQLGVFDDYYKDTPMTGDYYFYLLTEGNEEFINAIMECRDYTTLDYLPYNRDKIAEYHLIMWLSILRDELFFYEYYMQKHEDNEPDNEHYDFAIAVNANQISKYIKDYL